MRFAQVTGVLYPDPPGYRIVVMLDTRSGVQTVRDERIAELLIHEGVADASWTVDQLTQETIGTTLAEGGWEAVAQQPVADSGDWSPPMASYLVRG